MSVIFTKLLLWSASIVIIAFLNMELLTFISSWKAIEFIFDFFDMWTKMEQNSKIMSMRFTVNCDTIHNWYTWILFQHVIWSQLSFTNYKLGVSEKKKSPYFIHLSIVNMPFLRLLSKCKEIKNKIKVSSGNLKLSYKIKYIESFLSKVWNMNKGYH